MRELVRSTRRFLFFAAILAAFAITTAAEAGAELKVFAGATWIAPLDDSKARLDGADATLEAGSAAGLEVGVEWRIGPRIGLEASLVRAEVDLDFGDVRLGKVDFEPILLALDLHLVDTGRVDWWVAPTLFLFDWGEPDLARGVELGDDSETALGAGFGVDVRLSPHWALTAAVRYVDVQIRFGGGGEVAVDPFLVRAGLAWRPQSASGRQ